MPYTRHVKNKTLYVYFCLQYCENLKLHLHKLCKTSLISPSNYLPQFGYPHFKLTLGFLISGITFFVLRRILSARTLETLYPSIYAVKLLRAVLLTDSCSNKIYFHTGIFVFIFVRIISKCIKDSNISFAALSIPKLECVVFCYHLVLSSFFFFPADFR